LPKAEIEIFFEVPAEEFKEYFAEAVTNFSREVKIEGFCKGKAPKEIVEKQIGENKILEEAVNLAVKKSYVQVILQLAETDKLEVIGKPEIQVTKFAKGSQMEFKAKVFVMPEMILSDYKEIASKIKPKEISVEEKDIEEAIKFLQKSRAKLIPKKDSCETGDFVEIFFQSPQIENNKEQKDSFVLGESHFVAGFEENILGMAPNSEKKFSLTFPENYLKKEFAGKTVDFKVKLSSVSKIELPEINDDWAKTIGEFDNLDNLKKSVRHGIKMEKNQESQQKNRAEILEKIKDKSSLDIPEVLINVEKDRMIEEMKENLHHQFKMEFNDYLEKIKKTEEDLKKSFQKEAESRIKNFLILKEIAKKENIIAPDDEVEAKTNEFLRNYPDIKKAEKELDLEKLKEYYKEVITNEKVFQFLESL